MAFREWLIGASRSDLRRLQSRLTGDQLTGEETEDKADQNPNNSESDMFVVHRPRYVTIRSVPGWYLAVGQR